MKLKTIILLLFSWFILMECALAQVYDFAWEEEYKSPVTLKKIERKEKGIIVFSGKSKVYVELDTGILEYAIKGTEYNGRKEVYLKQVSESESLFLKLNKDIFKSTIKFLIKHYKEPNYGIEIAPDVSLITLEDSRDENNRLICGLYYIAQIELEEKSLIEMTGGYNQIVCTSAFGIEHKGKMHLKLRD
jgi:hypothetical protein